MYNETFYGDKKALEQIQNCSICIVTRKGIRNIKNYGDVLGSNLVYVANIPPYGEDYNKHIIRMGEMVNYIPINKENVQTEDIEKISERRRVIVYGSTRARAYEKLEQITKNKMKYGGVKGEEVRFVHRSEYWFTVELMNGTQYRASLANDGARGYGWDYAFIDNMVSISKLEQIILPSGLPGSKYEYYE